jgi:hypothetical protein
MKFNTMQEMLDSIRTFVKENPTAFIEVSDIPELLQLGFKATNDDGSTEVWSVPMVRVKKEDALSNEEHQVLQQFANARLEYRKAEKAYLSMITGSGT